MRQVQAFTLIEVLLALGILVAAVGMIAQLQMRSLVRVEADREDLKNVFLLKTELLSYILKSTYQQQKDVIKRTIDDKKVIIKKASLAKKSALFGFNNKVAMISATISDKKNKDFQPQKLITYVFNQTQNNRAGSS